MAEFEGNPHDTGRLLEEARNMVTYDPTNPTWMYRMRAGKLESKIFPADSIPDGWVDSPAKCALETIALEPKEPVHATADQVILEPAKATPKRRGRPRKVKDGDSA